LRHESVVRAHSKRERRPAAQNRATMQRILAADIAGFHKAHEISGYALGGAPVWLWLCL
jgi:hypothetical protein